MVSLSSSLCFSFLNYMHCCCSVAKSCPILCNLMDCRMARLPCPLLSPGVCSNSCPLSRWCYPTNHLILCYFLLLLPPIFPSIRVLSNESALHIRWPKYRSFSISPSNEYSGLISFRIDWLDLLAVQGTLKSLLQHHSSKASVLQCSAFFMVQLSQPYMNTGKTIALTILTFVSKAMSLLFNTLSRFVIAFLPRSKCLLISWLQSLSAVILEPKKIKSATISICFPSVCHEVMGLEAMILVFECWVLSQFFHYPLSSSLRGSLVSLLFLPLGWYLLHIWGCWLQHIKFRVPLKMSIALRVYYIVRPW